MMVPHFRPSFSIAEQTAAKEVIKSQYVAQGRYVQRMEELLAQFVHKKFGIAVSSGTTALILALKALKITPDDEVIIPSYTCTALWHAVKAIDAIPVFADVETTYYNLDPADVKNKLSAKTRAIIFPHMFGQPGRIQEVIAFGIPVIEDIAQSIGANIAGQPIGSFGALTIMSFYATKVIGAGEGGAIFTDDATIADYLRDIREYDEKEELIPRINAKMSDITAAIVIEQFKKLPMFLDKRNRIFRSYEPHIENHLIIPVQSNNNIYKSNNFRCIVSHPEKTADEIIEIGKQNNVTIRKPVFRPIHQYIEKLSYPATESAWQKQASVPIFTDMTDTEILTVIDFLKNIFR